MADHALSLARALADLRVSVSAIGRQGDPTLFSPIPALGGVRPLGRGVSGLAGAARALGADWVVVQYVPFMWARFGLAPSLLPGLWTLRRQKTRIAFVIHEPYVPYTRLPWLITGPPMRLQLFLALRLSDRIYAPVAAWVAQAKRWARPGTPVALTAIGGTLPKSRLAREEARRSLGIAPEEVAVGVFSPAASGFLVDWVLAAHRALQGAPHVRWFLFGFGSEALRPLVEGDAATRVLGTLSGTGPSDTVRAMDILLAPYVDGLTRRRSGAMLGLRHGIPTVSSRGHLFDESLAELAVCAGDRESFVAETRWLVANPADRAARATIGTLIHMEQSSVSAMARLLAADLT